MDKYRMKASELIRLLADKIIEYGDLHIYRVNDDGLIDIGRIDIDYADTVIDEGSVKRLGKKFFLIKP